MKFEKKDIICVGMITFSALIYSFGFVTFVHSGNLFPGGYSGVSRLLSMAMLQYFNISVSFSVLYFSLNVITTLFIWKKIGHKFVIYSILWYSLASLFTAVIPSVAITNDELLLAVFGGLFNGFAIGIALRNNASSGGTDFIAIYLSMKYNMPTWNYIMAANATILTVAGLLFGWNRALYSIIFQFVSTQVVNTMHQRYKLTRVDVVTNMPEEICQGVFKTCRHGITKIPCEGGYTDKPHWLLLITINTYQLKQVVDTIHELDPHAFITLNSVERIIGNYYQKPLE
ncbi:MAG: YitT family protein [Erysipelotrichia bacterium]|nr:YitT family protein [Erysipelotrichia bacterium]